MVKRVLFAIFLIFIALGVIQYNYSPVLLQVDRDKFAGGKLSVGDATFMEEQGSGRTFHVISISTETEISIVCGKAVNQQTDREGYLTPHLQWYVSVKLTDCSIADYDEI